MLIFLCSYAFSRSLSSCWGELLDLEAVAEIAEKNKRWSFFLTVRPLNVEGGVATLAVIFLDWVNSKAPWRSRLWIGVDPANLIGWMEWV